MKSQPVQKLIFVYNADSGWANALLDGLHKILSPSTYPCHLCELTFGTVTEKGSWKKFRERSAIPMVFLHRDEFKKQYASKFGHRFTFPIVLSETDQELEVFLKTETLNALASSDRLIAMVSEQMKVTDFDS